MSDESPKNPTTENSERLAALGERLQEARETAAGWRVRRADLSGLIEHKKGSGGYHTLIAEGSMDSVPRGHIVQLSGVQDRWGYSWPDGMVFWAEDEMCSTDYVEDWTPMVPIAMPDEDIVAMFRHRSRPDSEFHALHTGDWPSIDGDVFPPEAIENMEIDNANMATNWTHGPEPITMEAVRKAMEDAPDPPEPNRYSMRLPRSGLNSGITNEMIEEMAAPITSVGRFCGRYSANGEMPSRQDGSPVQSGDYWFVEMPGPFGVMQLAEGSFLVAETDNPASFNDFLSVRASGGGGFTPTPTAITADMVEEMQRYIRDDTGMPYVMPNYGLSPVDAQLAQFHAGLIESATVSVDSTGNTIRFEDSAQLWTPGAQAAERELPPGAFFPMELLKKFGQDILIMTDAMEDEGDPAAEQIRGIIKAALKRDEEPEPETSET